jgi:hypothetical protein
MAAHPASAGAAISEFDRLPYCGDDIQPTAVRPAAIVVPWQTVLDAEGVVVGHRVTIRQVDQDIDLSAAGAASGRCRTGGSSSASGRRAAPGHHGRPGARCNLCSATRSGWL